MPIYVYSLISLLNLFSGESLTFVAANYPLNFIKIIGGEKISSEEDFEKIDIDKDTCVIAIQGAYIMFIIDIAFNYVGTQLKYIQHFFPSSGTRVATAISGLLHFSIASLLV